MPDFTVALFFKIARRQRGIFSPVPPSLLIEIRETDKLPDFMTALFLKSRAGKTASSSTPFRQVY
ncbi:hypothetical protein [Ignatzschineria cameli]|uniref:hypothetical protein n=1 Tax=Ignatzschineria cameli TaxID=2182793 RepID=UPI0010578DF6|nr:hypothetical protein [Ignatzschineria cameli]